MEAEIGASLKVTAVNSHSQGDAFIPEAALQEMIASKVAKKLEDAQTKAILTHPMVQVREDVCCVGLRPVCR